MSGSAFGRVIAIVGAGLGAIGALLSIGGSYPWWSLGIFFLCLYVLHRIFIFGEGRASAARVSPPEVRVLRRLATASSRRRHR
jgi:hypothetical protein